MRNSYRVVIVGLLCLFSSCPLAGQDDKKLKAKIGDFFRAASANAGNTQKLAREVVSLGDRSLKYLAKDLEKRSPREIVWAIRCFKNIKSADAADDVAKLLEHENGEVRSEAVVALGKLDPSTLSSQVFTLAKDPELMVRRRAFDAALTFQSNDPRMLGLALDGLEDGDYWLMSRALRLLAKVDPKSKADLETLKSRALTIAPKLKNVAANMAMGFFGKKLGRDFGVVASTVFKGDNNEAIAAALRVCGNLKLRSAADEGREFLDSEEQAVQIAAIGFLSAIKDKKAARRVIQILEEAPDKSKLKTAAVVGLRRISGKTYGFEPAKWKKWLDSQN